MHKIYCVNLALTLKGQVLDGSMIDIISISRHGGVGL